MHFKLKSLLAALVVAGAVVPLTGHAAENSIKVGFITDLSGPYSDLDGPGGVEAVRMAVHDFGGQVLGKPIQVLSGDHQNKADIAASIARKWWDLDGVNLVIGGGNSSASLAINNISKEKKKVFISAGAGADGLTEEFCQPYGVRYTYSTSSQAIGTATALLKQGWKKWYFITADYAFGHSMEAAARSIVTSEGGTVVGAVRAPLNTSDFSSFLLQAQGSGADVLALANAGADLINTIKTANEFGMMKSMHLSGLMVFVTDIHSLGLAVTQGMYLTTGWYWNLNDKSREFSQRFYKKLNKMPTLLQAGAYSSTLTYLKAVKAVGSTDPDKVMKELKSMKIDDMFTSNGHIRGDGTMVHDIYLMQVKSPSESKGPWDYYKQISTIPGSAAFKPLKAGACSMPSAKM